MVRRSVLRVVLYRFHAMFAMRVGGYLTLAVLVGLLGGVAMASVAAKPRMVAAKPQHTASLRSMHGAPMDGAQSKWSAVKSSPSRTRS